MADARERASGEGRGTRKDALRRLELRTKRFFDVGVSLLALLILAPVAFAAALAIAITMGRPVIFKQKRIGHHGRIFVMFKFRTMSEAQDRTGALLPDEQRLTPLGRVLRSTSLDEVPEFVNVLRGDMSVVGPRPLLAEYAHLYSARQWRRHEMPPGIAGPVLAMGRNALGWEEKFQWDVWYVENWSIWLDLRILLRTARQVLTGQGVSAEGHVSMPRFQGSKDRDGS
jgi:sugar transferase EpsL